jgi:hypothetical protein
MIIQLDQHKQNTSFAGVLPKYFSSEWSFSQFRLREEIKSIVAFSSEKHSIYIAGSDGR